MIARADCASIWTRWRICTRNRLALELRVTVPRWLLRFGFHLLYNQMAFAYDLVAWLVSFGQWAAWRRTVILFLRDGPILDLAHGTGGLAADLTAQGMAPVGLDLSSVMGRLASRRMLRQGMSVRLVRGRAQQLPFPKNAFGNVVATFPADFILDPETLESVARVLLPGGRLIIVVLGHLQGSRSLRRLVTWAYQITGQRDIPESNAIVRLTRAGFSACWQDATLEGASARLLVATRL